MAAIINDSAQTPTAGADLAGMILAARAPRILNHDIMGCTAEGVLGNQLYSGRVLGASDPGDLSNHPPAKPGALNA